MNLAGRLVVLLVAVGSIWILSRIVAGSRSPAIRRLSPAGTDGALGRRIAVGGIAGVVLFEVAYAVWRHYFGTPPYPSDSPQGRALALLPYLGGLRVGGTGFACGALASLLSRRWSGPDRSPS
ncbi:MAG: hypothetical protein ACM31I_02455 [Deltaproteobacteria bacterium]